MSRPALVDTYPQFPLHPIAGHGSRLQTADGREYWDLYGGHAVALLGHAHPAVSHAVAEQMRSLTFYSNVVPLDIRTRAAEALCRFAGPGLPHVFFCNSGAEANENALKLALQQTRRTRIATLEGGWHGRTLLALSATTEEKLRKPVEPLLVDCVRLRPNVVEDCTRIDESIAALIVEPIQSIAGIVELQPEFLLALRRRCDATGTLLIYDEIQTGVGRLGRPYAAGADDVWPDMVASAKGLANGLPIGAVLMNAAVAANVKQGDLGSTFGGGPVVCAALLAVLETLQREDLLRAAAQLGELARRCLHTGPVLSIRGRGGLLGLELDRPAKPVHQALLERGFITGTSAHPHVLRLMPPLNLPAAALHELAGALHEVGAVAGATSGHPAPGAPLPTGQTSAVQ